MKAFSRRQFLTHMGHSGAWLAFLTACGAGADAALKGLVGRGLLPVAWADDDALLGTKPGMTVLTSQPINGEFAPHLLDAHMTPAARHFVRNNGSVPARAKNRDPQGWTLVVEGEVTTPLALSLDELQQLPSVTQQAVIECGGNGRALFEPKVRGNQWTRGAVACSQWTGVRLRDVLKKAGLKSSAVYTAHYGEDQPLGVSPTVLAWHPHREGHGRAYVGCLSDERGCAAGAQRLSRSARCAGLDRELLSKVAEPHCGAGPGTRLPKDDGLLLPRASLSG